MTRILVLAFSVCLGLAACTEPPIIAPVTSGSAEVAAPSTGPVFTNELNQCGLKAINDLRAANRRSALRFSPTLGRVARAHAADMRRRNVMSHTGGDGSTPAQRATRAGYSWCRIAENVAAGQPDLASVMQAWANSPGHRRNMLDLNITEVGIAQDGPYWAMVLGKPGC